MRRALPAPVERFVRSDFARHGLLVFASTSLANVLAYVFHFFVSRLLGVVFYGELSALIAILVLAAIPAQILTNIVVKYAAEFRAMDDPGRLRALVRTTAAGCARSCGPFTATSASRRSAQCSPVWLLPARSRATCTSPTTRRSR